MTDNKRTIETYMEGFREGDHGKILACLTNDVIWEMPGFFSLSGKEAFDAAIENDAFEGRPAIAVMRLVEEDDVVVAEGTVQSRRKDGHLLDAVFCDVFIMENNRIKQLTSYLMNR